MPAWRRHPAARKDRPPTRRGRPAGFTLIELLAVLLIIGLVAGLTFPNFSLGGGRVARDEARKLASVFGLARQRAIATGQPHRVVIDLDDMGYWIEHQPETLDRFALLEPPAQPDTGGQRVVQLAAPAFEGAGFEPLPGPFGRAHALPDAIAFDAVQTLAAGELRSGWTAITFEPDGSADAAELVLRHDGGEAWRVTLSRLADEVGIERE
jgi:prepilin-type N-terminal cleavage/methylation domain-containing protein